MDINGIKLKKLSIVSGKNIVSHFVIHEAIEPLATF